MVDLGIYFIVQEQNEYEYYNCVSQIAKCVFKRQLCIMAWFAVFNICIFLLPISSSMFYVLLSTYCVPSICLGEKECFRCHL